MTISGRNVQKTMRLLYSIYGNRCAKCGQPIDITLRYPHKMSGSIGHQLPRAKGGSDRIENLRPEHLTCNVSAGDSIRQPPRAAMIDASFFHGSL
ncbi:HNH endonuclease [Trueperella pyogenes]|uniref:HNH endonuclease n=2 Tax=Trueperella pyogenes TaxID=1661 RepID=UPI00043AD040|nr:hypothetical protein CQ11_01390 [Trueperella pyogenes]AWA42779.1 HNH endonuclease [Trueperella pyogenes]AZR03306.1 HNH endonuclease [Trueperella pyogenes]